MFDHRRKEATQNDECQPQHEYVQRSLEGLMLVGGGADMREAVTQLRRPVRRRRVILQGAVMILTRILTGFCVSPSRKPRVSILCLTCIQ